MTVPAWSNRAANRAADRSAWWSGLVVAAVVVVAAGCSGSGSNSRDDRGRITAAINDFGTRLVGLHDIVSVPAAVIGECQSAGWSAVSWSAPLTQHTSDPIEQENNIIGLAGTSLLRLDTVRILNPPAAHEPGAIYATKDRRTQVTLTVPEQREVRVDGYAACKAPAK